MPAELILIIEDNEKNRKLVRDVLNVKGYKTVESETAEAGIELATEKSPRLILMDVQLPEWMELLRSSTKGQPRNENHTYYCDHGVSNDL